MDPTGGFKLPGRFAATNSEKKDQVAGLRVPNRNAFLGLDPRRQDQEIPIIFGQRKNGASKMSAALPSKPHGSCPDCALHIWLRLRMPLSDKRPTVEAVSSCQPV